MSDGMDLKARCWGCRQPLPRQPRRYYPEIPLPPISLALYLGQWLVSGKHMGHLRMAFTQYSLPQDLSCKWGFDYYLLKLYSNFLFIFKICWLKLTHNTVILAGGEWVRLCFMFFLFPALGSLLSLIWIFCSVLTYVLTYLGYWLWNSGHCS